MAQGGRAVPTGVGALVALDVGDARIGMARADEGSSFAFGRGAITRRSTARDVAAVVATVAAEGANTVVVGLPLTLDGGDSPQTARVRAFGEHLRRALEPAGVEVVLEDERLTTRAAQRQVASGSLPRGKRRSKGLLDEAAAVLILESYLARTLGRRDATAQGGPDPGAGGPPAGAA